MKSGLEYFPLDVHMDDKIALIEAEFGLTGFAVIVKLYQKIYSTGYYCEWTNEVALLFGKKIGLGGNAVSEIVKAAIKRGIFDKDLFDKYHVLTSEGIQKRYFEAVSRRKKVEVEKAYLLLRNTQVFKNVYISGANADISEENAYANEQSKGKESKGKESRGEEAAPPPAPTKESLYQLYGKQLTDVYLVKAARYRHSEEGILLAAAEWLAKDTKAGTASKGVMPVENSSLELDEYEKRVLDYVPVFEERDKT